MTAATAPGQRAAAFKKLQMQLLPESAALIFVMLMTSQVPGIGTLLVVVQLGFFALLVAARPAESLQIFLRWWPLLLTPILAFGSFMWSELASVSARYGFQLLFTAFAGVLVANMVPAHRFIHMTFLAMLLFCVASLASRRMGLSMDGLVLVGYTGSKNQMALAGFVLALAAVGSLLLRETPRWVRLAAIPGLLIGLLVVAITESATAVVLTGITCPLLFGMHVTQRMSPAARATAFLLMAVLAAPLAMILPELLSGLGVFVEDVLGRDATLTGRTYLWARAGELIEQEPVFGHGYQAVMMGDSYEALALRRWSGVTDGRAFHFHNTYLQVGVDTGYVGMITFALMMGAVTLAGLRQFILRPTTATTYFFVNFIAILALSFTELVLAPMLPRTLILYAGGVYLMTRPAGEQPPRVYRKSWAHGR